MVWLLRSGRLIRLLERGLLDEDITTDAIASTAVNHCSPALRHHRRRILISSRGVSRCCLWFPDSRIIAAQILALAFLDNKDS